MYQSRQQAWDEVTRSFAESERRTKICQAMFGQDNLKGLTEAQRDKFWANVQIRNQNKTRWNQLRAMHLGRRPGRDPDRGPETNRSSAQSLGARLSKAISRRRQPKAVQHVQHTAYSILTE